MRPTPPKLPTARWISNEPTQAQVRWVMWLTISMFVVGFFVVLAGHIPRGY